MVVAFEKGLENMRDELDRMGFNTVVYGEFSGRVDAVVYNRNIDIASISNSVSSFNEENGNTGILLVNSYNKTAGEIAGILKNRIYSALF